MLYQLHLQKGDFYSTFQKMTLLIKKFYLYQDLTKPQYQSFCNIYWKKNLKTLIFLLYGKQIHHLLNHQVLLNEELLYDQKIINF